MTGGKEREGKLREDSETIEAFNPALPLHGGPGWVKVIVNELMKRRGTTRELINGDGVERGIREEGSTTREIDSALIMKSF